MAISSIGVGSGLPLDKLLSDLRKAESRPLVLLERRSESIERRLSAFETARKAVQELHAAAKALTTPGTFSAVAARTTSELLNASATPEATAGQYRIDIQQLATRQTLTSTGYAERQSALANGDVEITFQHASGQPTTITVPQVDTSLTGIARAINDHAALGLAATLIHDGGALPHRLHLTTGQTGIDQEIHSISVTGTQPGMDVSAVQALLEFQKDAQNNLNETPARQAILSINGVSIRSGSNTIDNAIQGVTLTLSGVTPADLPVNLSITEDRASAIKATRTFVNAYNNLIGLMKNLTAYDARTQQGGPLSGDIIARQLSNRIREALNAGNRNNSEMTLPQLGLSHQVDGTLKLNETRLGNALKKSRTAVQTAISAPQGLGERMVMITDFYDKPEGVISQTSRSMNAALRTLSEQHKTASARIDARMDMYRSQFMQLDAMVNRMNSVSTYLTQQLSMLNITGKDK